MGSGAGGLAQKPQRPEKGQGVRAGFSPRASPSCLGQRSPLPHLRLAESAKPDSWRLAPTSNSELGCIEISVGF